MNTENSAVSDPKGLIAEQRSIIDGIDTQIANLICERYKCVLKVGAIKKAHNIAVHDPNREIEQISKLSAIAKGNGVPQNLVLFPFRMLIAMSRSSQGEKNNDRLEPRVCWSCHVRTYGLDDPGGSNFRVCPSCQMPLL